MYKKLFVIGRIRDCAGVRGHPALRSCDPRPVSPGALSFPGFIPDRHDGICVLCVHHIGLVQIFRSSLLTVNMCGVCRVCTV
jgi:hypothetical protein